MSPSQRSREHSLTPLSPTNISAIVGKGSQRVMQDPTMQPRPHRLKHRLQFHSSALLQARRRRTKPTPSKGSWRQGAVSPQGHGQREQKPVVPLGWEYNCCWKKRGSQLDTSQGSRRMGRKNRAGAAAARRSWGSWCWGHQGRADCSYQC